MMHAKEKLVLIGMPGSGKSTLGRRAAKILGCAFYDLDQEIESKEGRKIREIFAAEGEAYFRQVEHDVLDSILSRDEALVLSTGGGAPCYDGNMTLTLRKAVPVWLDVPLEELAKRLQGGQQGVRPLFAGLDAVGLMVRLRNMHDVREPFYRRAKIKLSGSNLSAEQLVNEWLGFLKIESKG